MRVHHLNCGSHCPIGGSLFDGCSHGLLAAIPTRCLVVETEVGLVLIDTGYGLQDVRRPHPRLPHIWRGLLNIRLRQEDTAIAQIKARGFQPADVRHIVLTHLDFDHAGGIEDFPHATVHVLATELDAARAPRKGFVASQRYRRLQWDADIDWRTYRPGGDAWFGFEAVRRLDGLPPEVLMIPLRGHTLGHAGVAISTESGWLLHAGDAFLHNSQIRPDTSAAMPPGLALYQHIMDSDRPARRSNQRRLRALEESEGGAISIVCSHDFANAYQ